MSTETNATVNVRHLIRDVVTTTDLTDWDEITNAVLNLIDPADYKEALYQALRTQMPTQVASMRVRGPIPTPPMRMATPVLAGTGQVARQHVSSKFAAISNDWQQRLREQYPAANGQQKRLADFDRQDLLAYADRLRLHARSTMNRAASFQNLAEALTAHKVTRVSDLPDPVAQRLVSAT